MAKNQSTWIQFLIDEYYVITNTWGIIKLTLLIIEEII